MAWLSSIREFQAKRTSMAGAEMRVAGDMALSALIFGIELVELGVESREDLAS